MYTLRLLVLSAASLLMFTTSCDRTGDIPDSVTFEPVTVPKLSEIVPLPATDDYGFLTARYEQAEARIQRNESLYVILRRHGVSPLQIEYIQRQAADVVNLKRMMPGQVYTLYKRDDTAVGMVWQLGALEYVVIKWEGEGDEVTVRRESRDIEVRERLVSGTIDRSLYETLLAEGISTLLGAEMAKIFAWQVNFFTLREGDRFTAIFEERYVDDRFIGIGKVHAATFEHRGNEFRAYYFENEEQDGYFDEEGNSLEKALLQAPFEYNQRISSGFSHNRLHPILNQRRPHYGIDYAAPTGTPIIAVGDGQVTEAQYRGGNGNIVQIRHNSVYRTAYLHLSRFASGIRPGVHVTQGQVIGYVGQTGLATGPHLCYRLYVNNSPVNSLTVELPASEGLNERFMAEFSDERRTLDLKLEGRVPVDSFASISSDAGADERN